MTQGTTVHVFSNTRVGLRSLNTHLFKRGCPKKKPLVRCNRLAKLQLPSCPTATISPGCRDASLAEGSGAANPLPPPPHQQQSPAPPPLREGRGGNAEHATDGTVEKAGDGRVDESLRYVCCYVCYVCGHDITSTLGTPED